MTKKILIATTNDGKKKEMLSFFKQYEALRDIDFLSLKDFPEITDEPEENGTTFEANAMIKAKYFGEKAGIPTLGEDSGLIVSAFPEKFGLRTRREIQAFDDVEWLRIFLEMMEGQDDRMATFYSSMAYYDPASQTEHVVLGQTSGEITEFPQAPLEKGIPVSAVFIPEGCDDVYSAMTKEQKNAVSHRGWSARYMAEYLETVLK